MPIHIHGVAKPEQLIADILAKVNSETIDWGAYSNLPEEVYYKLSDFPQQGSFSFREDKGSVVVNFHKGRKTTDHSCSILHGRFVEVLLFHFKSCFSRLEIK